METLTFNGVLSSDYGIYVIGNNDATVPEYDYESVDIPGVTRAFHQSNKRFRNKEVVYHCICKQEAAEKVPLFCGAIMQYDNIYKRLTDTIHPEYYKIGTFVGGTQPKFYGSNDVATFDLIFDCDPRKYLLSGETFIDLTPETRYVLTNARRGLYYNPLFYVSGISQIRVYRQQVAGGSLSYYTLAVFEDDAPALYFDTETKYAYTSSSNADKYVVNMDFKLPQIRYPGVDYEVSLYTITISGASNPFAKVALREYML